MKRVAMIAIGDELLRGLRKELNCLWLAGRLTAAGWRVTAIDVISDVEDDIVQAVDRRAGSVDLLVLSGGLGPTPDDRTRSAIASCLGCGLEPDDAAYDRIVERYSGDLKERIDRARVSMGMTPAAAKSVFNPQGAALGVDAELRGTRIVSLPGVPWEFKAMAQESVLDVLETGDLFTSGLRVAGLGESSVEKKIESALAGKNVGLSLLPAANEVEVILSGARDDVAPAATEVRRILRDFLLPEGAGSLAEAVVGEARANDLRFCFAESCTGGMLGGAVTDIPGASEVFAGSAVCYGNRAKTDVLGVPDDLIRKHGAVSRQCAEAMAEGAAKLFDADVALAVTGVAGPDGGSPEKPVGLVWFALCDGSEIISSSRTFPGDRAAVRRWSVAVGLEKIWRTVSGSRNE